MSVSGFTAKAGSFFNGEHSRKAYAGASNNRQALKIRILHPIATRSGAMRTFYNRKLSDLEGENTSLRGGFTDILSTAIIKCMAFRKLDPFDNTDNSLLNIKEIATGFSEKKKD